MTSISSHNRPAVLSTKDVLRRLAQWARDSRELLGLSQDRAARGAGISQGGVSRIESGRCVSIPYVSYYALARFYRARAARIGATFPTPDILSEEGPVLPPLEGDEATILLVLAHGSPKQRALLARLAEAVMADG